MVVPKSACHLPRPEVKVALALSIKNLNAFGAGYDGPFLKPSHIGVLGRWNHPTLRDFLNGRPIHAPTLPNASSIWPPVIFVKCLLSTISRCRRCCAPSDR